MGGAGSTAVCSEGGVHCSSVVCIVVFSMVEDGESVDQFPLFTPKQLQ